MFTARASVTVEMVRIHVAEMLVPRMAGNPRSHRSARRPSRSHASRYTTAGVAGVALSVSSTGAPSTATTATVRPRLRRLVATTNEWNAFGETTAITCHASKVGEWNETSRFGYDRSRDLVSVTDAAGNISRYGYDLAGRNATAIADETEGGTSTQCFTYDGQSRLTLAITQTDCPAAPDPAATPTGSLPYRESYSYDAAGNRTTDVVWTPTGDISRTYTHPSTGQPRPHAVSSATVAGPSGSHTDTFSYDDAGNTTEQVVAGATTSYTWDPEGWNLEMRWNSVRVNHRNFGDRAASIGYRESILDAIRRAAGLDVVG